MKNIGIRNYARIHDVRLWQIAAELNLCDSNFSRLLRHELPAEKQAEIRKIIDEIVIKNSKGSNAS